MTYLTARDGGYATKGKLVPIIAQMRRTWEEVGLEWGIGGGKIKKEGEVLPPRNQVLSQCPHISVTVFVGLMPSRSHMWKELRCQSR
jgi:hypothetical protein